MRRDAAETGEGDNDLDSDASASQPNGSRFQVVDIAVRGPFRYAVLDGTGEVRDAFRSRRSAEHAARMLALGAGYDPHAVLGARVFPLSAPPRSEDGSGLSPADHIVASQA